MNKTIITLLLPLLGPFIGYFLWQLFVERLLRAKNKGRPPEGEGDEPSATDNKIKANHMAWCLLAGVLLAVLSIIIFGLNTADKDIGAYTPPVYEDGKIKAGNFNSQ